MSKSKTILAGLGVVAALGTAALPLCSYATTVSGDVDLYVEVLPAISMTITGNNDDYTHGTGTSGSGVDDVYDDGEGTQTGTVDGKTVSVATSAELTNTTTTPAAHIGWKSATKSSSYISILPNSKVDGAISGNGANGFGSTITVYTNNRTGYTLSVKDTNEDGGALKSSETGSTATIPAGATISAGTSAWGYKLEGASNYVAVTDSDVTVDSSNTKTGDPSASPATHGRVSNVVYGVSTSSDQETGLYTNTITYTATTN